MITIFTDGAARGNPGPGGWGAVISYKQRVDSKQQDLVTEIGGKEDHTTNNRMELTAVIKALEFISIYYLPSTLITIHTDSEYIVKGITSWVKSWQANNWRTAAKKPVLNQDLWEKLIEVVANKNIKWYVVPGHSGVLANERSDEIATAFADLSTSLKAGSSPPFLYNGPREHYTVTLVGHVQTQS